ncbi:NAD(P)H-dependent oxidoreductase [Glaciibacter flavus]|uniref:NAD(P)H-dependent oxidoreductase n=1 Tax=Orlajensenia flava TaxID=2565934 RepID=UPI003B00394C
MRIMLVLDHPYTIDSAANVPHERSFTAAVAAAAIAGAERGGHDVDLVDLAADGFNPAMTRDDLVAWRLRASVDPVVLDYQRRLFEADHLVFAFPIWWEAMPAATKGFLDRVLVKGVAYEELPGAKGNPFRNRMTRLQGVTALTVMTTPTAAYRWWFGDPMRKILFKGTFGKIGVKNLRWRNYANVADRTDADRARLLDETAAYFAALPARQEVGSRENAG